MLFLILKSLKYYKKLLNHQKNKDLSYIRKVTIAKYLRKAYIEII